MATSTSPITTTDRKPLRLRMRTEPGSAHLDGGWWPQTRDLGVELRDLVDNFPKERTRIMRAVYSPPDWDVSGRRVEVERGFIRVESFPRDDTHVILLSTAARTVLRVLVIPPGASPREGARALDAAADSRNDQSAQVLLGSAAS